MVNENEVGDAYVRHFTHVLRTILEERGDFRQLYSRQELACANQFLTLTPIQQYIYARLFQRKGPWFKITSLTSYFTPWKSNQSKMDEVIAVDDEKVDTEFASVDPTIVQTTVQMVVNSGLLDTLSLVPPAWMSSSDQDCQLSLALDAIQHCANAQELGALWKKLNGSKKLPSSASSMNSKAELFTAIKRLTLTQRRVDGSRIPIAKLIHRIWLEQLDIRTSEPDNVLVVVRIADTPRALFYRMHRLAYIQSSVPSRPLTISAAQRLKTFPDIVQQQIESSPPSTPWAGLLVIFKKIKYPEYPTNITLPLFETRESYVCYELAARLHRLMNTLELELAIETSESPPLLPVDWNVLNPSFEDKQLQQALIQPQLIAFQRLSCVQEHDCEWQLGAFEQLESLLSQWTLDEMILETRRCLRLFAQIYPSHRPGFYVKCTAGYHLTRVLHIAVSIYEKQRHYLHAIALLKDLIQPSYSRFLVRKRGYWYDRLALDLKHVKQYEQAKMVCMDALKEPTALTGADRIAMLRRMEQYQEENKSSQYIYKEQYMVGRPLNRAMGERSRFIGFDDEPCCVEQLVLQSFQASGWYGVHDEGCVLTNLFGLYMWDILYAPVPNVFQTLFQIGPLDFGSAIEFYQARKDLIETWLATLESEWSLEKMITCMRERWNQHEGEITRFVTWNSDIPLVYHELVVRGMGKQRLVALFRHMIESEAYHQAQNGWPDVLMIRCTNQDQLINVYESCGMNYSLNLNEMIETNADVTTVLAEDWSVEVQLIEVKGPRDRLSDQQIYMLTMLNDVVGISASVMHVVEDDDTLKKRKNGPIKKTRKKKKTVDVQDVSC